MLPARWTGERVAVPLAIALNLALAAVWGVRIGREIAGGTPYFDFPALYAGWRLVIGGGEIYDFAAQGAVQRQVLGGDVYAGGVLPFVHPPHAAMVLAPLGWLSLRGAYLVWLGVQLGLLGILVWQARRLVADRPPALRWLAGAVVLAFPPVAITVWFGQVSLLVLLGLAGLALALRRPEPRTWSVAGALLLVSIKPQLLIFPVLAVLVRAHLGALARFGAALLGLGGVSAAALGADAWAGWLAASGRLASWSSAEGLPVATMHNLRGLLTAAFGEGARATILTASALALLAAALAFVVAGRRLRSPDLLVALAAGAGAFFSVHLFVQDDGLYLLAAGLACDRLAQGPRAAVPVAAMALLPAAYQLAMPPATALLPLVVGVALALALRADRPGSDPARR